MDAPRRCRHEARGLHRPENGPSAAALGLLTMIAMLSCGGGEAASPPAAAPDAGGVTDAAGGDDNTGGDAPDDVAPDATGADVGPSSACTPTWVKHFAGAKDDFVFDGAADDDGNVVLTGKFVDSLDVGGQVLQSGGGLASYVVRLAPEGTVALARVVAAGANAKGIDAAPSGEFVITGFVFGPTEFDGQVVTTGAYGAVFVARYSADGELAWIKTFDGGAVGHRVALGPDGVFVAALLSSTMTFGPQELKSMGSFDIALLRLDPAGQPLWARLLQSPGTDYAHVLTSGAGGGVTVGGSFFQSMDVGAGPMTGLDTDGFIATFDAAGTHVWSRHVSGKAEQRVFGADHDAQGDVLVTGSFGGTDTDVGGGPLPQGHNSMFIARLDGRGGHVWSNGFDEGTSPVNLAVTSTSGFHVVGGFYGDLEIGEEPIPGHGAEDGDAFVAKFDKSGAPQWACAFGAPGFQTAKVVAADGAGGALVAGVFEGTVAFGPWTLTSQGERDVFVMRLGP